MNDKIAIGFLTVSTMVELKMKEKKSLKIVQPQRSKVAVTARPNVALI